MSDEGYNGWKNYPTWCVNLWLANEQYLSEIALEIAQHEEQTASTCEQVREGIWTLEQARRFNTADALKYFVHERSEDVFEDAGMAADLYGWALDHVDWHEIADAWLESAREAREYA